MKRSSINDLVRSAAQCFHKHGWALPPEPRWDVTDFGLGDSMRFGLVLINLAEEPEYCEKLMYARKGHDHARAHAPEKRRKTSSAAPGSSTFCFGRARSRRKASRFRSSGTMTTVRSGEAIHLQPGERVTLVPGVWHEFIPASDECIIGEVSTANDDLHDNFFVNPDIGRFPGVEEDEAPLVKLLSDRA